MGTFVSGFSQFTVVTEVPGDGDKTDLWAWVPIVPAYRVEFEGSPSELAASTIAGDPARGGQWRARVWEGFDADTSTMPAAEHYAR